MIDLKFVEQLLDLLNRTSAGEIEVRKSFWGGTTVRVARDGGAHPRGPVTYHVSAGAPAAGSGAPAAAAPGPAAAAAAPAANLLEIKSPMVGTYYAQPEPGAEAYARVGSRVKVGQTLCIIEAMKIMNPLDSEVAGVIREILVDDAQPVEFGQVLFRVDPNG
jgi:acetyl-CoA carboxylase biotin carboxyl carrier protein